MGEIVKSLVRGERFAPDFKVRDLQKIREHSGESAEERQKNAEAWREKQIHQNQAERSVHGDPEKVENKFFSEHYIPGHSVVALALIRIYFIVSVGNRVQDKMAEESENESQNRIFRKETCRCGAGYSMSGKSHMF